nr:peptidase S45 [uncultured bacterium]
MMLFVPSLFRLIFVAVILLVGAGLYDRTQLIAAHRKWNAMPWINTIATSSDGRAVYLDNSNVGNLSEEAFELWDQRIKSDLATKMVFSRTKMVLADGSDSRFEWQIDPSTNIAGVVPFDKKPLLDRSDFVFNSNDSYWLTNPSAPLTGYSPLYGQTGTPRSIRTRVNATMLGDTSPTGHAGEGGRFSLAAMQAALFSNRSLAAELFREWLTAYAYNDMLNKSSLFAIPFDVNDPVNTPRGVADKTVAQTKLAHAVTVLNRAGLALNSTLADAQFAFRSGTNIAVPGGNRHERVANLMLAGSGDWRGYEVGATKIKGSSSLTDKGYPVVHGSSFLLCLSFTDDGPHAEAVLAYSQSGDPTSEHYTDQTRMFAKEQLRPVLFRKQDIEANEISSKVLTSPQ